MSEQHPDDAPAPHTGVEESDPNADSPEGLAGDMGVSSERRGAVPGADGPATYGVGATHPDEPADEADPPPEQSSRDPRPDVQPDDVGQVHRFDPDKHPGH